MTITTNRLTLTTEFPTGIDALILNQIRRAGEFEMYLCLPDLEHITKKFTICKENYFAIMEKETNTIVGYLGISQGLDYWEHEIYIFQEYRRRGYAFETLQAILNALFAGSLQLSSEAEPPVTIGASVRVENIPSQKLLTKLGFSKEPDSYHLFVMFGEDLGISEDVILPVVDFTLFRE